jgi:hypothetical protein
VPSNPGAFEVNKKKMVLKLSNNILTVKSGGGYLPINQYLAIYPLAEPPSPTRKSYTELV